jgi:hypothetical protein
MPGDLEQVKKRLGKLGLPPRREEEISRELGEHVEDHAAELQAAGLTKDQAQREALESVRDWPQLREQILVVETGEVNMNYRTKVLWLPAFGALFMSNMLLAGIQIFGPLPHFFILHPGKGMQIFILRPGKVMEIFCAFLVPWLFTQPAVGAVAAWWSRRAGGVTRHQLLAALSPAIALLAVFVLILPWAMIVEEKHNLSVITFLVLTVTWVLLPAVPLLLGAAPFLRRGHAQA